MKMFKIKVEYETVILAENFDELRKYIKSYIREIDDQDYHNSKVSEIEGLEDLPEGWDGECRPWGERDPHDRTIAEILNDVKN
jgi:hypothetical protein